MVGGTPIHLAPARVVHAAARVKSIPTIVRWSFLLFVFTIPFEAADLAFTSGSFSLARLTALFFFAIYCFYLSYEKSAPRVPPAMWWFLGYLAVYVLNGLFIPERMVSIFNERLLTLAQLFGLFWIGSSLLREEKLARIVLLTFSIAAVILALGTIVGVPGFINIKEAGGGRITSLDFNANYVALLMAFAVVVLMGLLLDKTARSIWGKAFLVALSLSPCLFIVQTGSRAGVGALLIGISLYLIPYRRSKRKLVTIIWVAFVVVGIIHLIASNPVSLSRWQKAYYEGNTAGRDKIYPVSIDMISERPLFGWQPGAAFYELARRESHLKGEVGGRNKRSAHNLVIHLLLEVGLVGTAPFLVGLWLCARAAWKARVGSLGMMPLALLATILAYSMAHTTLTKKPSWLILSLIVATASVVVREQKERSTTSLGREPFRSRVPEAPSMYRRTEDL